MIVITKARLLIALFFSLSLYCQAVIKNATDYEEALKTAAKEDKKFFLLFTNSQRCAPCKRFKSDIFTKEKFIKFAKENLVVMVVDYSPIFSKENKKSMGEIEKSFNLPTKVGYRGRGPWPYLLVYSPKGEQIFSGPAYDAKRADVDSFIKTLNNL